jgi:RNA polymerase sigma-70 factor (ECF subfamily)
MLISSGPSPQPQASLEELIGCARVDDVAFAQLYHRTSELVYRVVVGVLRDRTQADEVTQDIYLYVWENCSRFRPEAGSALTWLLTIAHHRAVDRVRRCIARSARDRHYAADMPLVDVAERAQALLDAELLHQALNRLPDTQRQAVTLSHLGGYTHAEIADLLDVPLGTVKTRIRDGLRRLRTLLDQAAQTPAAVMIASVAKPASNPSRIP